MLGALLRHAQALLCHFAVFPKVLRELTQQLIVCWSQGEEHVRVLAFLTLRRIILLRPHPTLSKVVKVTTCHEVCCCHPGHVCPPAPLAAALLGFCA